MIGSNKDTINKVLTHDFELNDNIQNFYDWFSGDINDIIVQCITKEGE